MKVLLYLDLTLTSVQDSHGLVPHPLASGETNSRQFAKEISHGTTANYCLHVPPRKCPGVLPRARCSRRTTPKGGNQRFYLPLGIRGQ